MRHHPLADHRRLHLAQFEGQRRGDVVLFAPRLADEELPRLAVVIGKALGAQPALGALLDIGERREAALAEIPAGPRRTSSADNWRGRPGCASPCGRPAGNDGTDISAR